MVKVVSFANKAVEIAGHLHLPDDFREDKTRSTQRSSGFTRLTSMDKMLSFSVFTLIPDLLTQPLLLIAVSTADTNIFSDQAYALSNGPKELFVVEGATH